MNKYLLRITGTSDHRQSQYGAIDMLHRAGIYRRSKWHHAQGCDHYWTVTCDPEELSVMVLLGAVVHHKDEA